MIYLSVSSCSRRCISYLAFFMREEIWSLRIYLRSLASLLDSYYIKL